MLYFFFCSAHVDKGGRGSKGKKTRIVLRALAAAAMGTSATSLFCPLAIGRYPIQMATFS